MLQQYDILQGRFSPTKSIGTKSFIPEHIHAPLFSEVNCLIKAGETSTEESRCEHSMVTKILKGSSRCFSLVGPCFAFAFLEGAMHCNKLC